MIRRTVTSLVVLFLSACGADGEGRSSGTSACSSNSNCGVSSGGSVNSSDTGECEGATDCSHCPETPLGVCIEGQCRDYDSALGCALPAECIDADGDGYPLGGCEGQFPADCDDSEPRAHPNQRAFFPEPYGRSNDSYDYNCDGVETEEWASRIIQEERDYDDCISGWVYLWAPTCGEAADWAVTEFVSNCIESMMPPQCQEGCETELELRIQACR